MNPYALPSDNITTIKAIYHCAVYSIRFKNIPSPDLFAAMVPTVHPLLLLLLLADSNELTGTSQPNARGTLLPP